MKNAPKRPENKKAPTSTSETDKPEVKLWPEVWPEDQDWLLILEPALATRETASIGVIDPGITKPAQVADTAARIWSFLIQNIEAGPVGQQRALTALRQAWRLTMPFTEEHRMLDKLMARYLRQDVPIAAEPLQVLERALEEGMEDDDSEGDTTATQK